MYTNTYIFKESQLKKLKHFNIFQDYTMRQSSVD